MKRSLLFLILTFSVACTPKETRIFSLMSQPVALSKDDVLLINGTPLSLTSFLSIRSQLKNQKKEAALWVSIATLCLIGKKTSKEHPLSPTLALDVARYAIQDLPLEKAQTSLREYLGHSPSSNTVIPSSADVKKDLEELITHSTVQKNIQILSDIQ